jgi:hypothetical protein
MGGFFSLHRNGVSHRGILTNRHVVRPERVSPAIIKELNKRGYRRTAVPFPHLVKSPAEDNLKEAIEANDIEQAQAQKAFDGSTARLASFDFKEQIPPTNWIRLHSDNEEWLERCKSIQSKLNELPIILGELLFSSGDGVSTRRSIIDWAFVELKDAASSLGKNRLPTVEQLYDADPRLKDPKNHTKLGEVAEHTGGSYGRELADIEEGDWYYKVSRTTNITTGICLGVYIEVQREAQVRYEEA